MTQVHVDLTPTQPGQAFTTIRSTI